MQPTKSEIILRNKKYIVEMEYKDRQILKLNEYIDEIRKCMKEAKVMASSITAHRNNMYDLFCELRILVDELEEKDKNKI